MKLTTLLPISKTFDGQEYQGSVTSIDVDESTQTILFHVNYHDDDDSEDFDLDELSRYIDEEKCISRALAAQDPCCKLNIIPLNIIPLNIIPLNIIPTILASLDDATLIQPLEKSLSILDYYKLSFDVKSYDTMASLHPTHNHELLCDIPQKFIDNPDKKEICYILRLFGIYDVFKIGKTTNLVRRIKTFETELGHYGNVIIVRVAFSNTEEADFHKTMKLPIHQELQKKNVYKYLMKSKTPSLSRECYQVRREVLSVFKENSKLEHKLKHKLKHKLDQWWHPHYHFEKSQDYFLDWEIHSNIEKNETVQQRGGK